ncbi:uncharacterized protein LOC128301348 [Anopheles moucheti]|uniref:uncharacterized protein LOC128301348 n=1 Tax=Anopheles moucheti TaxID=186751 RepID=UPI0022F0FD09|nr:uncharacterized protein LOC128301348 [Anopheles moucheti]
MADTNIETYFMSLEFWFAASGIGALHDTRKYNIVMAQVPPNKLTELRAIIDGTPAVEKYAYIKAKLIGYFADSQQRRLQRVLSDMPLGDRKPSQLLNEMKRVAGNSLSEPVLIDLWASRLPPHAQAAVIASSGDAADKTTIADAIVESMSLRSINAVERSNPAMASGHVSDAAMSTTANPASDPISDLRKEIAELSRRLENVLPNKSRGRSVSRSRLTRRRSLSRGSDFSTGPCWYHRKFGSEARKCRKPCTGPGTTSAQ